MKYYITRNGSGFHGYRGLYIIDTKKEMMIQLKWKKYTHYQIYKLLKTDIRCMKVTVINCCYPYSLGFLNIFPKVCKLEKSSKVTMDIQEDIIYILDKHMMRCIYRTGVNPIWPKDTVLQENIKELLEYC